MLVAVEDAVDVLLPPLLAAALELDGVAEALTEAFVLIALWVLAVVIGVLGAGLLASREGVCFACEFNARETPALRVVSCH